MLHNLRKLAGGWGLSLERMQQTCPPHGAFPAKRNEICNPYLENPLTRY
jgi:hypothetical protein